MSAVDGQTDNDRKTHHPADRYPAGVVSVPQISARQGHETVMSKGLVICSAGLASLTPEAVPVIV